MIGRPHKKLDTQVVDLERCAQLRSQYRIAERLNEMKSLVTQCANIVAAANRWFPLNRLQHNDHRPT